MFYVKLNSINHKTTGEPFENELNFYSISRWIANSERINQTFWFEYNRVYLDFSSESLIVRFKKRGKQS